MADVKSTSLGFSGSPLNYLKIEKNMLSGTSQPLETFFGKDGFQTRSFVV